MITGIQILNEGRSIHDAVASLSGNAARALAEPLAEAVASYEASFTEVARLNRERVSAVNRKAELRRELLEQVKRARAGVLSAFGDDSTEYQLVGRKRRSDRKRPVRKTPPSSPSPKGQDGEKANA